MTRVGLQLGRQVAERAGYCCEYCQTPQAVTAQPFHVDHILPRSRGGRIQLIGRTATGRATIAVLQLNAEVLVQARKMWILLRLLD